jgi:hypothetical protein
MTTTPRLLRAAAALGVVGLAATVLLPQASAASSSLKGTISWTTTVALNDDQRDDVGFKDLKTGTTTWSVTMKVKLARGAGSKATDAGSSYVGTFKDDRVTQERTIDGAVECTITSAGTGDAGGKLPKNPTSTTPPALFATVLGSKGIVLTPLLAYKGTQTTTYAGSGTNPCDAVNYTDPITGSLAPTYSSEWICYPAGTTHAKTLPNAGQIVGAWSASKKQYSFDCTHTWKSGPGQTITTTLKGTLK